MADGDLLSLIQPVDVEVLTWVDYSGLDSFLGGFIDVVYVTDELIIGFEFGRTFSDTVTVTDAPVVVPIVVVYGNDSVVVTDLLTFANVFNLSFSDTVTVTDLGVPSLGGTSIIGSDPVTVVDATTWAVAKSFVEFVSVADDLQFSRVTDVTFNDSVTMADTSARDAGPLFQDSVAMSESMTIASPTSFINTTTAAPSIPSPLRMTPPPGSQAGDLCVIIGHRDVFTVTSNAGDTWNYAVGYARAAFKVLQAADLAANAITISSVYTHTSITLLVYRGPVWLSSIAKNTVPATAGNRTVIVSGVVKGAGCMGLVGTHYYDETSATFATPPSGWAGRTTSISNLGEWGVYDFLSYPSFVDGSSVTFVCADSVGDYQTDADIFELENGRTLQAADTVTMSDSVAVGKLLALTVSDSVTITDVGGVTGWAYINGGGLANSAQVPVSTSGAVVGDLILLFCPSGNMTLPGTGWTKENYVAGYNGSWAWKLLDSTANMAVTGVDYSYSWEIWRGPSSAARVGLTYPGTGAVSHTWPTPVDCQVQLTFCQVVGSADMTAAAGFTDRVNYYPGTMFRQEWHDRFAVQAGASVTTCPNGNTVLIDVELRRVQRYVTVSDSVTALDGMAASDPPELEIVDQGVVVTDNALIDKLVSYIGGVVQGHTSASFTPNWSGYGAQPGDVALIVTWNGGASPPFNPAANYTAAQGWEFDAFWWTQYISYADFVYQKTLTAGDIATPAALAVYNTGVTIVLVYRGIAKIGVRGMTESISTAANAVHPGITKDGAHRGLIAVAIDRDPAAVAQTPPTGFTVRGGGPAGGTNSRANAADLIGTSYVDDTALTFTNMQAGVNNHFLLFELLYSFDPTPLYEDVLSTPPMASNTTPAPYVADALNNGSAAYYAFDQNDASACQQAYTDGGDGHVYSTSDFRVGLFEPVKRKVGKLGVVCGGDPFTTYFFEGSNNATNANSGTWVTIAVLNQNGGTILIPKRCWTAFKSHRLRFPQGNTADNNIYLNELRLWKGLDAPPIPPPATVTGPPAVPADEIGGTFSQHSIPNAVRFNRGGVNYFAYTFAGAVDRYTWAVVFNEDTGVEVSRHSIFRSGSGNQDDHNNGAVIYLASGKLLFIATPHNTDSKMYQSVYDFTTWTDSVVIDFTGKTLTYVQIWQGANGRLFFISRITSTEWHMMRSINDGVTWTNLAGTVGAMTQVITDGTQMYMAATYMPASDKAYLAAWEQPDDPNTGQIKLFEFNCATEVFSSGDGLGTQTNITLPIGFGQVGAGKAKVIVNPLSSNPNLSNRIWDFSPDFSAILVTEFDEADKSHTGCYCVYRRATSDPYAAWTKTRLADSGAAFDSRAGDETYYGGMCFNLAPTAKTYSFFLSIPTAMEGQPHRIERWDTNDFVTFDRSFVVSAANMCIRPMSIFGAAASTPMYYLTTDGYSGPSGFVMVNAVVHFTRTFTAFTPPSFPSLAALNFNIEGTALALNVAAVGGTSPYTIGLSKVGYDYAKGEVSGTTGRWASAGVKDFDAPNNLWAANAGANAYQLRFHVTDANGASSQFDALVVVTTDPAGTAYTFASDSKIAEWWHAADYLNATTNAWVGRKGGTTLAQATSAKRPVMSVNSDGVSVVTGDGADDYLENTTAFPGITAASTEICFVHAKATADAGAFLSYGDPNGAARRQINSAVSGSLFIATGTDNGVIVSDSAAVDITGGLTSIVYWVNGAAEALRRGGDSYTAATRTNTAAIGTRTRAFAQNSSSIPAGGSQADVAGQIAIMGMGDVSTLSGVIMPFVQRIEGYIAWTLGASEVAKLPAAHPFKNARPSI